MPISLVQVTRNMVSSTVTFCTRENASYTRERERERKERKRDTHIHIERERNFHSMDYLSDRRWETSEWNPKRFLQQLQQLQPSALFPKVHQQCNCHRNHHQVDITYHHHWSSKRDHNYIVDIIVTPDMSRCFFTLLRKTSEIVKLISHWWLSVLLKFLVNHLIGKVREKKRKRLSQLYKLCELLMNIQ